MFIMFAAMSTEIIEIIATIGASTASAAAGVMIFECCRKAGKKVGGEKGEIVGRVVGDGVARKVEPMVFKKVFDSIVKVMSVI